MKKIITLLLALCMVMSMSVPAFSVETETYYAKSYSYSNPIYGEVPDEEFEDINLPVTFADPTYMSYSDAAVALRSAFKERAESFYIYIACSPSMITIENDQIVQESFNEFCSNLFYEAVEHTGEPTEGDYIYYNFKGYEIGKDSEGIYATFSFEGDTMYVSLPYYVAYHSTADNEEDADAKVAEIISSLDLDTKTTYQKIKAIYDYLCSNVGYDHKHLDVCGTEGASEYAHSACAALLDNKSVCQGYASAFYRLALEAGIDARVISGTSRNEAHAWNIVEIGDVYYNVDATWDAGETEYDYFLKCMDNFTEHTRQGPMSEYEIFIDYTSTEFNSAHPMSTTDYDPASQSMAGLSITSGKGAVEGTAKVSVEITENTDAAMIQFTLDFDPEKLQVDSLSSGEVMKNMETEIMPTLNYDNEKGKIYFAWEALEGIKDGGSILDIVFKITEDAAIDDVIDIGFSDSEKDDEETIVGKFVEIGSDGEEVYEEIEVESSDGNVTVIDKVIADISGTVTMWNNSDDVVYLIYPADTTDADIKADAKLDDPQKDIGAEVTKGTVTASGKQYSQTFTIEDLEEGEYKLVVYKKAHGIWIESVEIAEGDITGKDIAIYLLGDVNKDGRVNATDLLWIKQSILNKRDFDNYQKVLANVNDDTRINATDLLWVKQRILNKRNEDYSPKA